MRLGKCNCIAGNHIHNEKSLVCGKCNAEILAETKKEPENAVIEHMNSIHQLKRGQLRIPA